MGHTVSSFLLPGLCGTDGRWRRQLMPRRGPPILPGEAKLVLVPLAFYRMEI